MRLHCLHGFLGSPRDWDDFEQAITERLREADSSVSVVKADLFGADGFPEASSLSAWADAYGQRETVAQMSSPSDDRRYLVGYSLGGRLALHLATQLPSLWDGVIIIGANPGLDSEQAREERRQRDEVWAQRFETEPWNSLVAAWDAQPVFAGRHTTGSERREREFSRERLADALRRWSLGNQDPVWPALRTLSCPVLWIAGADDIAQAAICQRVRETIPHVETWIAPDAGHRVPWEQPQAFTARVGDFLLAAKRRIKTEEEK